MDINHIAVGGVWEVGGMDVGSWDEGGKENKRQHKPWKDWWQSHPKNWEVGLAKCSTPKERNGPHYLHAPTATQEGNKANLMSGPLWHERTEAWLEYGSPGGLTLPQFSPPQPADPHPPVSLRSLAPP